MTTTHKPHRPTWYQLQRHIKIGSSGVAIIFAFDKFPDHTKARHGTDQEIDYLKSFFLQLNLRVSVLRNLTLPQMELALKEITNPGRSQGGIGIPEEVKKSHVSRRDSMSFIAITSHGDSSCFELSDGNTMKDIELEKYFYEDVCSSLAGCPKLFLYNKCRNYEGEERFEMASPMETIESDGLGYSTASRVAAIPNLNMLSVYTCADGIKSLRLTSSGSPILRELPKHYREYGSNMEVIRFFTKFIDKISSCIGKTLESMDKEQKFKNVTQIPSLERNTLRYELYFDSPDVPNDYIELGHEARQSASVIDYSGQPRTDLLSSKHRIASSQKLITTEFQVTSSLHSTVRDSRDSRDTRDTHIATDNEGYQPHELVKKQLNKH